MKRLPKISVIHEQAEQIIEANKRCINYVCFMKTADDHLKPKTLS